jgi:hypothetical protein
MSYEYPFDDEAFMDDVVIGEVPQTYVGIPDKIAYLLAYRRGVEDCISPLLCDVPYPRCKLVQLRNGS